MIWLILLNINDSVDTPVGRARIGIEKSGGENVVYTYVYKHKGHF